MAADLGWPVTHDEGEAFRGPSAHYRAKNAAVGLVSGLCLLHLAGNAAQRQNGQSLKAGLAA